MDRLFLFDLLVPLLAQEGNANGVTNSVWFQLWPFLIIGVLFYFMLIAPERRKRKEMEQLLGNIKKNDLVVTIGGICGTVIAHLMFDLAPLAIGTTTRSGPSQWLAEAVATFTLVLAILGGIR